MSKIVAVIEIDSDDFQEFIENIGGTYDENYLFEDLNGMLDDLPVCTFLRGYNIEKEQTDEQKS